MSNYSQSQIDSIWAKATLVYDGSKWRKDPCGAWIHKDSHGKRSLGGWEVDHAYPEAKGGDNNPINLRAMHWENNRSKDDNYPSYTAVVIAGNKDYENVSVEKPMKVSEKLQKELKKLYDN